MTRADRVAQAADLEFEEERLRVVVQYSVALRWQMHLVAVVIAALVWQGQGSPLVAPIWLAATVSLREFRAARLEKLVGLPSIPVAARQREVTLLTLLLGTAYGSSALFMPWMPTAFDAILTMILLSLSAGAINTTFTLLPAFVAFGAPLAVPCALMWAVEGDWFGAAIALMTLLFFGVQVRFARQTMSMFETSYRMRLANHELLRQLSNERARLAAARDVAVAADMAKSRFLAAASHDLRQPLQSLTLCSAALEQLPLPDEGRELATEMSEGIESLSHMLNGLLDMSRLDSGADAPTLQPVMLERVVQGMRARFAKAAESKGLALLAECAPGLTAVSDAQMLQRVVSNLLDNAIKFTDRGQVSLRAERRGERVSLSVADTGRGIGRTDVPRAFEDLEQLDNPQRDRSLGHGLGLGIVRRLCRLLGIELVVQSEPGRGTTMQLTLPSARDDPALPTDSMAPHPGLVARRVLVLDDDAAVRRAYARLLGLLGCEVTACASAEEAFAALARARPEVALLDYRLAGNRNGLQVARQLRVDEPELVAIVVSADTTPALRAEAEADGVQVLRKPVTDTLLALTINRALAEARLGQEPGGHETRSGRQDGDS